MAYEVLDKAWNKPKSQMTPMENFINGCLAAAFAQVTLPFLSLLFSLLSGCDEPNFGPCI